MLNPCGIPLIANLTSFNTACGDTGWVKSSASEDLYYPLDNYFQERSMWIEYSGIRVRNHHRPMSTYMRYLLDAGLRLTYFDEPAPSDDAPKSKSIDLSPRTMVPRDGLG